MLDARLQEAAIAAGIPTVTAAEQEATHDVPTVSDGNLPHEDGYFKHKEDRRYRRLDVVGSGTYGAVYRTLDTKTGLIVAVKKMKPEVILQQNLFRELSIVRSLQGHPNIMNLMNVIPVVHSAGRVDLVTEFLPLSLERFYQDSYMSGKLIPMPLVQSLLRQLLSALTHLEASGVVHRDLKPSNMLLQVHPELDVPGHGPMPSMVLKLCDFGTAKLVLPGDPEDPQENTPLGVSTPCWRAPEVFLGSRRYGCAVDVWAAGCVFAELLTGTVLFYSKDLEPNDFDYIRMMFLWRGTPGPDEWKEVVQTPLKFSDSARPGVFTVGDLTHFPQFKGRSMGEFCDGLLGRRAGELGVDLINRLLTLSPTRRLTALEALQHPFFQLTPEELSPEIEVPAQLLATVRYARPEGQA